MAVSPHSSSAVLEVRRNIKKIQTSNTETKGFKVHKEEVE
jgi:hypothetical protein